LFNVIVLFCVLLLIPEHGDVYVSSLTVMLGYYLYH
jgi:hypothetical protein